MLVGIVLRGSAFAFRSYDVEHDRRQLWWGRVFASASVVTPVLLGVSIGAIASGRVALAPAGSFADRFVAPWLTPFALSVGLLALALFAFLAAVFLTLESGDRDLSEDFRKRALGAGIAVFFAAALVLLLSDQAAPLMWHGLVSSGWALRLHLATAVAAVATLAALWFRYYALARAGVVAQVTLIFWGWLVAQYPYLLPPDLTIERAAPPATLRLIVVTLAVGAVLLLPSLLYLFRVFKSAPAEAVAADRGDP